jgi:CRISPR-associated protein Cas1
MKFFSFESRPKQNNNQIPHVRVPVAHLIGPGKLRVDHEHLVFESDQTRQIRIDAEGLAQIIAYGEVVLTGKAMQLLEERLVGMSWLDPSGSYVWGRLANESSQRSLTRLLQFQAWNDELWQRLTARKIVKAKVTATEAAVRHYQRQGKALTPKVLAKLQESNDSATSAAGVEQLRGIEGNVAALWYKNYGALFNKNWVFEGRSRRPPRDPVNALLSLGYMQVYRRVAAQLEARGYETTLGALHEFRPGRLSLACDLMEPLRIPVVDRWVLGICQQGIVRPNQFTSNDKLGVRLEREQLPTVLGRFEEHWHQGFFQQQLDASIAEFATSLREHVSADTSRAASYLKHRVVHADHADGGKKGLGISEVYEP